MIDIFKANQLTMTGINAPEILFLNIGASNSAS
jgi:hypothetical protein